MNTSSNSVVSSNTILAVVYLGIRIALANKAPITDCDEVYNYWEPLHFLIHGSGMQTWEYAPQYALRTYVYLLPLSILYKFYHFLTSSLFPKSVLAFIYSYQLLDMGIAIGGGDDENDHENKVFLFQCMRCSFAASTALCELRLAFSLGHYIQSCSNHDENNSSTKSSSSLSKISIWALVIFLTSTGMFHASPAYLPSTTAMLFWMNSASCQLDALSSNSDLSHTNTSYEFDSAIIWGLMAILTTGWPFCFILFIPLGLVAIYRSLQLPRTTSSTTTTISTWNTVATLHLIKRVILYAIFIQTVVMGIDYQYYGKIVSPTLNIFIYNTGLFSGSDGDGEDLDELYGVEDVSYYIKNLILNWNLVALMGIVALPCYLFNQWMTATANDNDTTGNSTKKNEGRGGVALVLIPMYLWIGIFFPRPHKEERFLFPIYPMLVIGSVLFLDLIVQKIEVLLEWVLSKGHRVEQSSKKMERRQILIGLLILVPMASISIMRSMLLADSYIAPLKLFTYLYYHAGMHDSVTKKKDRSDPLLVCTGGEWYRFPSSFHLPKNAQLAFLQSSFDGQLPQQFTEEGSKEESLRLQKGLFNDMNEGSIDRYVTIQDCSFVIEMFKEEDTLVLEHSEDGQQQQGPECIRYIHEDGSEKWREVVSFKFMDVDETSTIHRLLYIPFFHKTKYQKLSLFERK